MRRSLSMSPHYSKLLEKLKREESIQTNQWNRFVDCLTHEDVDMGTLLQLSYASLHGQGFWILDDLRSLAWQLLLVHPGLCSCGMRSWASFIEY
ncbi:hypothetical protein BC834DRAFT_52965 [Gloeopeniophorella convolvens]|nr:hypothetical protein BC834DRAFT_52965 [Gloeopeniophorella convolvens]